MTVWRKKKINAWKYVFVKSKVGFQLWSTNLVVAFIRVIQAQIFGWAYLKCKWGQSFSICRLLQVLKHWIVCFHQDVMYLGCILTIIWGSSFVSSSSLKGFFELWYLNRTIIVVKQNKQARLFLYNSFMLGFKNSHLFCSDQISSLTRLVSIALALVCT